MFPEDVIVIVVTVTLQFFALPIQGIIITEGIIPSR
jgi:hypothetical protein